MPNYEYTPLNQTERNHLYKRVTLRGILLVVLILFFSLGLPRILPLIAPFIVALVAAMVLNPLVNWLQRRAHINRRVCAFVLTFFVVSAIFFLFGWGIKTIVVESVSLAANVNTIWGRVVGSIEYLNQKFDWLTGLLPVGDASVLDTLTANIYSWLQTTSKEVMESALSIAANTTTKIGNIVVSVTVTLLATYFAIADYPRITRFVNTHTERKLLQVIQKIKRAVQSAFGGYLRSQLLMALMAFVAMLVALALYGQKYFLLIAIGLAVVDFLPIVGTIAVLIPWSVIELFSGDTGKAFFLLILGVGFFILRRVMEPRIVGSQTGLHPLVALAGIYIGLKISGVWGAILGPVVLMVAADIYRSGIFEDTITDFKDLYHLGITALKRSR